MPNDRWSALDASPGRRGPPGIRLFEQRTRVWGNLWIRLPVAAKIAGATISAPSSFRDLPTNSSQFMNSRGREARCRTSASESQGQLPLIRPCFEILETFDTTTGQKKIEKESNCASCVGEGVIVDSFAAAKICRTSFFPSEAHLWYAIRLRASINLGSAVHTRHSLLVGGDPTSTRHRARLDGG